MKHECNNCGKEFDGEFENMKLCGPCSDERAMAMMSDIEPPEGGWPRGSDMDRI